MFQKPAWVYLPNVMPNTMTTGQKYITLLTFIILVFVGCKKSAELQIHVYNEDIHEFTPNATVSLIERHVRKSVNPYGFGDLIFKCKVVATAQTDQNGNATIDFNKIKKRDNFDYLLHVSNAWGKEYHYSCGVGGDSFKSSQEVYLNDKTYRTGTFNFQVNNLFDNSITGDSLVIKYIKLIYPDIKTNEVYWTGFNSKISFGFDVNQVPYSNQIQTDTNFDNGVYLLIIKKIKNGVTTLFQDTVKTYPNRLTTIPINW